MPGLLWFAPVKQHLSREIFGRNLGEGERMELAVWSEETRYPEWLCSQFISMYNRRNLAASRLVCFFFSCSSHDSGSLAD